MQIFCIIELNHSAVRFIESNGHIIGANKLLDHKMTIINKGKILEPLLDSFSM